MGFFGYSALFLRPRAATAEGARQDRVATAKRFSISSCRPSSAADAACCYRLSASGRVCGRNDTPRQREARRPRLAAMTAKNDFIGAARYYQQQLTSSAYLITFNYPVYLYGARLVRARGLGGCFLLQTGAVCH